MPRSVVPFSNPIWGKSTLPFTYDLMQEILSHGGDVEVMAPAHLRNEVRMHAEAIVVRG